MVEEWRTIEGYPNYQVSNLGRVKSLERKVKSKGGYRIIKETLLKYDVSNRGYLRVHLYKNNKSKKFTVHRLVAEAFIPNPNNLPQCNHRDECKTNNKVDNLEWCTNEYNMNYGIRTEKARQKNINHPSKSKPVIAYKDGVEIMHFSSIMEAVRSGNGFDASAISSCCRGKYKYKTHKGLTWKYAS